MKSLSFALVLSLGLSSIGCAATEPAASEDADLKAATTLTEKDDGRTVSYNEGQSVIVALASNPSTGYDWAVTATDKTFGYPVTTKFVASSSKIGAGGTTKLTWATKGALSMVGKHAIELSYQRSWEKKPTKVLHFVIEILAAGALKPVRLTDANNKGSASAKAGQDVIVSLSSNPSTGYSWSLVNADKSFAPVETFESTSNAVGAGGFQVFTWKTTGAAALGAHQVTLNYQRAGDTSPTKTFTFSVTVAK